MMAAAAAKQIMLAVVHVTRNVHMSVFSSIFFGVRRNAQKSLLGFLLLAKTRHQFSKDRFRGVDEIGSKKQHL